MRGASPLDRLLAKVRPDPLTRCWFWTAAGVASGGYGSFWLDGRTVGAHRAAYELLVGPIPEGLHLDHLCRNPVCVNPDHLEPVTVRENTRRGKSSALHELKAACKHGHQFTPENTYWDGKYRKCRECHTRRSRAKYANDPEYRRRAIERAAKQRKAA